MVLQVVSMIPELRCPRRKFRSTWKSQRRNLETHPCWHEEYRKREQLGKDIEETLIQDKETIPEAPG